MGKRQERTTKNQIRSALRRLFLRSRERAKRIKDDKYTCQRCGKKQSKAKGKELKVEVHHREGICNWDKIFEVIYEQLLCNPEFLETLCVECHGSERDKPPAPS